MESADADVTVAGTVTDLNVNAPAEVAVADTGAVTTLNVGEEAEGANVEMAKNAKVSTINAKANMTTSGAGKPGKITAPEGVTVTEKESGKQEETTTPPSGGSSGGSSNREDVSIVGEVKIDNEPVGKDEAGRYKINKGWNSSTPIEATVKGVNFKDQDYTMKVIVSVKRGDKFEMKYSFTAQVGGKDLSLIHIWNRRTAPHLRNLLGQVEAPSGSSGNRSEDQR